MKHGVCGNFDILGCDAARYRGSRKNSIAASIYASLNGKLVYIDLLLFAKLLQDTDMEYRQISNGAVRLRLPANFIRLRLT